MSKFPAIYKDSNNTKNKSVPRRLRNAKKEVRKFTKTPRAKTPHFIVASMEKYKSHLKGMQTPYGKGFRKVQVKVFQEILQEEVQGTQYLAGRSCPLKIQV